ncbi:MAG: SDR family oxidoreductase [Eubacterium sp.]|jgi:UDP-glucose 4-epimerase|nr:SDR family oxidoreductase [Eubacterium sp.]
MTSLVTGGCGFIGSHMVDRLLSEGHDVRVIDNLSTGRLENLDHLKGHKNLSIYQMDIRNKEEIQPIFKDVDYIFHFAALADIVPSIQRPQDYYSSNVLGTFNVVECAKNTNIKKLLYAASSSCYGIPDQYPTRETAEIRPQYPYALTKRLGEETILHWGQVYGLPVITLRLFNVYGTRSRTSGTYGAVFGVFLAQKLANKPFTVVGDGTQTRDFTYVTDIVDAFYTAAMSDIKQDTFNVGSGGTYSINRLCELLGGEITNIPKRPGEPDCTFADTSKIHDVLGWEPKISFEDGVSKVLENIDYWRKAPVWTPDTIVDATEDWFKYLK